MTFKCFGLLDRVTDLAHTLIFLIVIKQNNSDGMLSHRLPFDLQQGVDLINDICANGRDSTMQIFLRGAY